MSEQIPVGIFRQILVALEEYCENSKSNPWRILMKTREQSLEKFRNESMNKYLDL